MRAAHCLLGMPIEWKPPTKDTGTPPPPTDGILRGHRPLLPLPASEYPQPASLQPSPHCAPHRPPPRSSSGALRAASHCRRCLCRNAATCRQPSEVTRHGGASCLSSSADVSCPCTTPTSSSTLHSRQMPSPAAAAYAGCHRCRRHSPLVVATCYHDGRHPMHSAASLADSSST